ncbi:hypothetical protein [Streptomyces cadmiisoli]|uniref:hypothetical protein n=1 Tax=Streptomyces cadmiisoli TaxID=2184053 RepID=UPI0036507BEA
MTPMPPEPCDTAIPQPAPVLPGGWMDLLHQIPIDDMQRIENVEIELEGVL